MTHDQESAGRAALVIAAVIAVIATGGCGASALDRGRTVVAGTARVVAAADTVAAGIVAERMDAAETSEQLERERVRADRVVRAFVTTHLALTAADSALDAVEAGAAAESAWQDAVACLLPTLLELADVLQAFGLPESVTEPLRVAVGLASGFLGGECRAP
ncbi:MAG: hypothetical protein MUF00_01570 [Gemmatimonadaceae bacterium]|nr:hypothetical protein [Gemmatimonadaceae bacterium]